VSCSMPMALPSKGASVGPALGDDSSRGEERERRFVRAAVHDAVPPAHRGRLARGLRDRAGRERPRCTRLRARVRAAARARAAAPRHRARSRRCARRGGRCHRERLPDPGGHRRGSDGWSVPDGAVQLPFPVRRVAERPSRTRTAAGSWAESIGT
jgi:hypothetical protein